ILRLCLAYKTGFLALPLAMVVFGLAVWLGFDAVAVGVFWTGIAVLAMLLGPPVLAAVRAIGRRGDPLVPIAGGAALLAFLAGSGLWWGLAIPVGSERFGQTGFHVAARHALPGLGKQFMPPLDEGSFLLMPVT